MSGSPSPQREIHQAWIRSGQSQPLIQYGAGSVGWLKEKSQGSQVWLHFSTQTKVDVVFVNVKRNAGEGNQTQNTVDLKAKDGTVFHSLKANSPTAANISMPAASF